MKKFDENLKHANTNLARLTSSLDNYTFQSQQPLRNNVEHKHHLHKGIWVAVGLFIAATFFLWEWIDTYQSKKVSEANDIKYRSLKLSGDKSQIKYLYDIDSIYKIKGEAIKEKTIQDEERLAEQVKILELAGEKENKAKELKRKATKGRVIIIMIPFYHTNLFHL
ncbi:MAG: hypothetical protein WKG06_12810 [Segetibacter sp.]